MEVRPYRSEDLARMPPRDCERASAVLERELDYIAQIRLANPSFTLWGGHYHTEPIASAGIIIFQPGVGEVWLRGSIRLTASKFNRYFVARLIRGGFERVVREHRLRRVQMLVRTDDEPLPGPWLPWLETRPTPTPQLKFALWLGFQIEGLLRRIGPNGENHYMMGWVREEPPQDERAAQARA